ncbi:MAG: hypothetical protein ACLFPE_13470 [Bacteroidales bacterium]
MKIAITRTLASLALFAGLLFATPAAAQNGDPPPPPSGHGEMGNQPPGGGAALGSGMVFLALLGAGYGAKKWYTKHKRKLAE